MEQAFQVEGAASRKNLLPDQSSWCDMRLMKGKQPEKPSWARSAESCRICRVGNHARAGGE